MLSTQNPVYSGFVAADVIGTMIYSQKDEKFIAKKGPIFANFILADEINRAPAKVQSALLEAMQERQVTLSKETFPLPEPFLVLVHRILLSKRVLIHCRKRK